MAIFSTKRAFSLGPGKSLLVIREDRTPYVTFVIVQNGEQSRIQHKTEFKLTVPQAREVAKFIELLTPKELDPGPQTPPAIPSPK